ncbi:MAG TPA: cation diffusion facilitator family transporter [Candidatus Thermoplasmatota archaeon]|nr:cation diffusion facilitator family transporter [Candidatus Thermoplasmatota archaeon]
MGAYKRAVTRILVAVLALNLLVALAKAWAGLESGSLALVGDALASGVDAGSNVVALVVIHYATRPADRDHPYGHRKFETLAAFVLSGLLFVTAFEVAREAIRRLVAGETLVEPTAVTFAVAAGTLVVNLAVAAYERRAGERLQSQLLKADAMHTFSDVFVTVGVLGSLALAAAGFGAADAIVSLGVAGFIAWTGFGVFREVAPVLTDRAPFEAERIAEIVRAVPGVASVHDIKSRGHPQEAFIQMHLVVEPRDLDEAHAVTEAVERALERELGAKEVVVHVEPDEDAPLAPGAGDEAR